MKNNPLILAALAASCLSSAAYAISADGNAGATVATALSLQESKTLHFGTFIPGATGGTIDTSGAVSGSVSLVSAGQAGMFEVTGTPSSTVNVAVPASVSLSNGGGGNMSATLSGPASKVLDNNGAGSFSVTGSLTVAPAQPTGNYTGTYTVTVNY